VHARTRQARDVRLLTWCCWLTLGVLLGCGDQSTNTPGTGGTGGDSLSERSLHELSCPIPVDDVVLSFPIDLSFTLDRPYTDGGSSMLTQSATLTFDEETVATLLDAGIGKIDIISVNVASEVVGATPASVETFLSGAPINDFDLDVDTDDNGIAGPHPLVLDATTVESTPTDGATEVELGVRIDLVSVVLGDLSIPVDCVAPTLVGFSASFAVRSPN
jgi:hypothetical protein